VHSFQVRLAGKGDQRSAIQERIGDGGDEVRRPRAQGPEAHAGPTGETSDRIGHISAALLVPDGHELDRRLREGLAEIERFLTRYPEYVPNTFSLEALDKHI
jgi:hypothetical protein